MKPASVFLSLLIITGSNFLYAQAPPEEGKAYENVLYKKGKGGDSLVLDIFMPGQAVAAHAVPVVMIIHGGGWAKGDIDEMIERLQKLGAQLVGEVVQYRDIYRLCYIRGPEGLLIGLAEELAGKK